MKKKNLFSLMLTCTVLLLTNVDSSIGQTSIPANHERVSKQLTSTVDDIVLDYKGSKVYYFGSKKVSENMLLTEAKLIDIADRRFETKWVNKDPKGISEEYTATGAVFMKPGTKPRLGRAEIEEEFAKSVEGVDRVQFFQDELQFLGNLDVAFQRCHMLGYVDEKKEHIFEGSYVILWKKVDGNWLIEYDMFNSDK